MKTRVRRGGQCFDRLVGNMAWATFVHLTARPILGTPDPHLHAHCYCFNAVYDPVESRWKAGQFRDIKQEAPRFQALFRSLLARRLADLGYPVEWKGDDFGIAGFSPALLDKFSRRTRLIEAEALRLGIVSDHLKDSLGGRTREKKCPDATMPELRQGWYQRMTPEERQQVARAELAKRRPWPGDPASQRRRSSEDTGEHHRRPRSRDAIVKRQRQQAHFRAVADQAATPPPVKPPARSVGYGR
jgi:hypothetical protein